MSRYVEINLDQLLSRKLDASYLDSLARNITAGPMNFDSGKWYRIAKLDYGNPSAIFGLGRSWANNATRYCWFALDTYWLMGAGSNFLSAVNILSGNTQPTGMGKLRIVQVNNSMNEIYLEVLSTMTDDPCNIQLAIVPMAGVHFTPIVEETGNVTWTYMTYDFASKSLTYNANNMLQNDVIEHMGGGYNAFCPWRFARDCHEERRAA